MALKFKTRTAKSVSYGSKRSTSSIKFIVIHFTGNDGDSAKNNANYFATGNTRAAGAHYFIDEGDIVWKSVPVNRVEGREEGIEQGEKRTQNSIIKKMLSMGQPLEFISECTDKPVEYIREIATKEPMLVREENTYGRYNKKKNVE